MSINPMFIKVKTLFAVALAALSLIRVLPSFAGTEFMSVPVEGQLSAAAVEVAVGEVTEVIFTVVPERTLPKLKLSMRIPPGVERVSGDLSEVVSNAKANEAIVLRARLRVTKQGPQRVVASAIVADMEEFALSKAFILDLNPAANVEAAIIRGTAADGEKIRIRTIPTKQ